MEPVATASGLAALVRGWRAAGESVAFVPTMGDLHAGHLALVAAARRRAARTVVSIFVNPLQFNDSDDLGAYPRHPDEDARALVSAGADALFLPGEGEIYPHGMDGATRIEVPGLSDILCGAFRPGHFVGVATVVAILFNLVRPDMALFGEKDYQQLLVVRRLVADLRFGIDIVPVATLREPDGLALSSRNRYLEAAERRRAPALYRALEGVRAAIGAGRRDFPALEAEAVRELEAAGLRPEYVAVRRATDLGVPGTGDRDLRVLAAAWLGAARLIDNVAVGSV